MLNGRTGYPCPLKCAVPYGEIVFVLRRCRAPAKAELFRMPTHPSQPKGAPACTKSRAVFRSPFVCLPKKKKKRRTKERAVRVKKLY